MDTDEYRWIALDTDEYRWIPMDSPGYRWIPIVSQTLKTTLNYEPCMERLKNEVIVNKDRNRRMSQIHKTHINPTKTGMFSPIHQENFLDKNKI